MKTVVRFGNYYQLRHRRILSLFEQSHLLKFKWAKYGRRRLSIYCCKYKMSLIIWKRVNLHCNLKLLSKCCHCSNYNSSKSLLSCYSLWNSHTYSNPNLNYLHNYFISFTFILFINNFSYVFLNAFFRLFKIIHEYWLLNTLSIMINRLKQLKIR